MEAYLGPAQERGVRSCSGVLRCPAPSISTIAYGAQPSGQRFDEARATFVQCSAGQTVSIQFVPGFGTGRQCAVVDMLQLWMFSCVRATVGRQPHSLLPLLPQDRSVLRPAGNHGRADLWHEDVLGALRRKKLPRL